MSKKTVTGSFYQNWDKDDSQTPILHIDMDAFYVEAELLRYPHLHGKTLIVGGRSGRGVVCSASYDARVQGVHAGMPVGKAQDLCPQACFLPVDHDYYASVSAQVMGYFSEITPVMEAISIDEAFLDVSGAIKRLGSPLKIAEKIRDDIARNLKLPASVGVGSNKLIAKIASQAAKPNGLVLIPREKNQEFLDSLKVEALWGVGAATTQKLLSRGIKTVRELREIPLGKLVHLLGNTQAIRLMELANGRDYRRVGDKPKDQSVGAEITFPTNVYHRDLLEQVILEQCYACAARLRLQGKKGAGVILKMRDTNFHTWTRSATLSRLSDSGRELYQAVLPLLQKERIPAGGVRLIGVNVKGVIRKESAPQMLWDDNLRFRQVEESMDQIKSRFGKEIIMPASLLKNNSSS